MDIDKLKIPTFETVSDIPYESPYLCWECQGEQYWDRDSGIISLIPQEKLNDYLRHPQETKGVNGEDLHLCEFCVPFFVDTKYLGNVWNELEEGEGIEDKMVAIIIKDTRE
jgi:hypothetical protein|tara:strand:+ start:1564 stop:1896 length:333 start_codon:yes stop_codon:yes gene_type:complete